MHPADQVVAFTKLVQAGQSVSSVAARFGLSERLVEQRLRLGNAAPELLDAYGADGIDLEVLKAFAVTTDRERQMAVWEQVSAQGYRPSAWQVKRLLTEERVPGATAVARFVGMEAYEAAGGQVLRDLFARDDENGVWFEDPVLLAKLATEKLQAAADELATRWKWAIAMVEVEWSDTARYGRIEPQPAERTPEEQAEIERLEARQAELAETDDESWTEELLTETEVIETRLDEIEGGIEARAVWWREDFGMAGCIVTIAHDGSLQVIQGLVKPEDIPKQTETGDAGSEAAAATTPKRPPTALTPPGRPSPPPWRCRRTARPRPARRRVSASGLPTICARSGRPSSRRISPGTPAIAGTIRSPPTSRNSPTCSSPCFSTPTRRRPRASPSISTPPTGDPWAPGERLLPRLLRTPLLPAALRLLRRHLLLAQLRPANIDGARGARNQIRRIVRMIRERWPNVDILLRGDSPRFS